MTTMTATTATLANSIQSLIDARLDTIDRMLLGRVPRSDRVAIAREVEAQIYELLGERDPDSLTREDVISVLARLDPPEAFLPDEEDADYSDRISARLAMSGSGLSTRTIAGAAPARSLAAKEKPRYEGRIGGVLSLCSMALILLTPVLYLVAMLLESEVVLLVALYGAGLLGIGMGIAGLVLSICGRKQGVLAIIGIVTGALSVLAWIMGMGFLTLLLL
jgi:hypothetical protein